MGINKSKLDSYRKNNSDREWKWSSLSPLECQLILNDHFYDSHKALLLGGLNAEKARLSIANTGEFIDLAEKANSELVTKSHFAQIIAMLPPRFTVQKIQKIFTTKHHGYSLSSGKNILFLFGILNLDFSFQKYPWLYRYFDADTNKPKILIGMFYDEH